MTSRHSVDTVTRSVDLPPRQIGKLGELLVQYKLLEHGIESAHLTTDAGVDLVAYHSSGRRAFTIQVKTNLRPKPAGGKGKPALDWWVPEDCPAKLVAFVDVSGRRVWLITSKELPRIAQQNASGRLHFYMYTNPEFATSPHHKAARTADFDKFLLERRITKFF